MTNLDPSYTKQKDKLQADIQPIFIISLSIPIFTLIKNILISKSLQCRPEKARSDSEDIQSDFSSVKPAWKSVLFEEEIVNSSSSPRPTRALGGTFIVGLMFRPFRRLENGSGRWKLDRPLQSRFTQKPSSGPSMFKEDLHLHLAIHSSRCNQWKKFCEQKETLVRAEQRLQKGGLENSIMPFVL